MKNFKKGDRIEVLSRVGSKIIGHHTDEDGNETLVTGETMSLAKAVETGEENTYAVKTESPNTLVVVARRGPARTSSPNYREGYDRIFGKPKTDYGAN